MATETKDKKPTAGNLRALFKNQSWLKTLRKRMGLGDTLGPLSEECGGTGAESAAAIFHQLNLNIENRINKVNVEYTAPTYTGTKISRIVNIRGDGSYFGLIFSQKGMGGANTKAVDVVTGSTLASGKAVSASAKFTTTTVTSGSGLYMWVTAWNFVDLGDGGAVFYVLTNEYLNSVAYNRVITVKLTSEGAMTVTVGKDSVSGFKNAHLQVVCGAFLDNGNNVFALGESKSYPTYLVTALKDGAFKVSDLGGDSVKVGNSSSTGNAFTSDGRRIAGVAGSTSFVIDVESATATNIDMGSEFPSSLYTMVDPVDATRICYIDSTKYVKARLDATSGALSDIEKEDITVIGGSVSMSANYAFAIPGMAYAYFFSMTSSENDSVVNFRLRTVIGKKSHLDGCPYKYSNSAKKATCLYRIP